MCETFVNPIMSTQPNLNVCLINRVMQSLARMCKRKQRIARRVLRCQITSRKRQNNCRSQDCIGIKRGLFVTNFLPGAPLHFQVMAVVGSRMNTITVAFREQKTDQLVSY